MSLGTSRNDCYLIFFSHVPVHRRKYIKLWWWTIFHSCLTIKSRDWCRSWSYPSRRGKSAWISGATPKLKSLMKRMIPLTAFTSASLIRMFRDNLKLHYKRNTAVVQILDRHTLGVFAAQTEQEGPSSSGNFLRDRSSIFEGRRSGHLINIEIQTS